MASNIGCFAAGCNNAVIGQCLGYRGNCGQFYCHAHSSGKLCSECGVRKHRDEMVGDYLTAARGIYAHEPDTAFNTMFWLVLISVIGGVVVMATSGFVASLVWGIFWLVLAVPFFFYWSHKIDKVEKAIADTAKTKSGFRKFYEWYKKEEEKAESEMTRQLALQCLGAAVGGAIDGTRNAVNEAGKAITTPPPEILHGTPRDVERAIQSLEKTIANKK